MVLWVLLITLLLGIGFVGTRVASMLRLPHSVLLVLLGIVGGSILKWSHAPIPHDWGESFFLVLQGEVLFGGLGTGLYSIILVALIGLFVGGLMVGRTPEYLGKPIGPTEMKLISLYALLGPATILLLTALAVVADWGTAGLSTNSGPHGLSEIVFAYTSSMTNNGQNFAGLNANSPFYNVTTAFAMIIGRFGLAIPALALAGHLALQVRRPVSSGTIPTDTPLFACLVIGTIVIVGGLSYLPILALGPVVEHLLLGT